MTRRSKGVKAPPLSPHHARRMVTVAATRLRHAIQAAEALRTQLVETSGMFPAVPSSVALSDAACAIAPLLSEALDALKTAARRPQRTP